MPVYHQLGQQGNNNNNNNEQKANEQRRRRNDTTSLWFVSENVRIDEISAGQMLTVNALARTIVAGTMTPAAIAFLGCTGIVTEVNVNTRIVRLLLYDPDTATKHCHWYPLQTLLRPRRLWSDPCTVLRNKGATWSTLAAALLHTEKALSVRTVRRAGVHLLAHWPRSLPFGLHIFGGANNVVDILKLAAAEFLSTVLRQTNVCVQQERSASKLLESFRLQLVRIVTEEGKQQQALASSSYPALRITTDMYERGRVSHNILKVKKKKNDNKDNKDNAATTVSATPSISLTQLLIEEYILHSVQAVHHPPPVIKKKSKHPYLSHKELRERVHIPGASKLLVTFDPRCHIGSDIYTRLSFYRDENHEDLIVTCNGQGHDKYPSFVVPSNVFWFKFTSGTNNQYWGYKFTVKPMEVFFVCLSVTYMIRLFSVSYKIHGINVCHLCMYDHDYHYYYDYS